MDISLIMTNGSIYTMNGREVEAMAVSEDRIVRLGTNAEIEAMATLKTEKIDLKGKTVLPGFNDCHFHLHIHGANRNSVNLEGSKSVEDIIEKGKTFVIHTGKKPGEWVSGWGWDQNDFAISEFPTKDDLDKISTENPIIIIRTCHHIGVMNSMAIEMVKANNESFISGGIFDKDEQGNLNGVFRENAISWVYERVPKLTIEQIKKNISAGIEEALSFGVTSLQTSDLHDGISFEEMYEAYTSLKTEGKLRSRINEQLYLPDKASLLSFLKKGFKTYEGDNLFRLGPVKLLTDGSLGARTAALLEDYSDSPGDKGNLTYTQEELDEFVDIVHQNGLQLHLHAIGDAAITACVDSIEKAITHKPSNHRHRINHVQIGSMELIERMARNGIMADIQPVFVSSDWNLVENRIGKARTETSYAWKTMMKAGIPLAGGTDAPVEGLNPMHGVYAAVTRKDRDGNPKDGWRTEESLSVYEALELYTKGSAYATYEENEKGTLAEGKLADMVVLSEDPFAIEPDRIKDIEVLMTILGGKVVYSK